MSEPGYFSPEEVPRGLGYRCREKSGSGALNPFTAEECPQAAQEFVDRAEQPFNDSDAQNICIVREAVMFHN